MNGDTEVRSTVELHADGTLLTGAEYFQNGKVTGRREVLDAKMRKRK